MDKINSKIYLEVIIMNKKNLILSLVIANLIAIFILLINKFQFVHNFISTIIGIIVTPIIFGVFLFYILKPLNKLLIKFKIKENKSPLITILIFLSLAISIIMFFGKNIISEIYKIKNIVYTFINNEKIYRFFEKEKINLVIDYIVNIFIVYINPIISNIKNIINMGMMLFSNILLIILIAFFLLKDRKRFKEKILAYIPSKYKELAKEIIIDGDNILSSYIIGQTIVAFSLAIMVFVGYLIIDMPSSLLLASITFVLAFIPFVGFFISMTIPYIIALTLGIKMVIKLSILVIIAQTLKGRIVVPFIMGKRMNIHPLTDIFLVVSAASLGGPLAAFSVVPIYAFIKMSYDKIKKYSKMNAKMN